MFFHFLSALSVLGAVSGFRGISHAVRPRASRLSVNMAAIAVFGGTGATGSECVLQALEQGMDVVVLARTPGKMVYPERVAGKGGRPLSDPKLTVLQGSVTDSADVSKVFESRDDFVGSIVALGGKTKDVGATMLTDGTMNVVDSMKAKSIKRIAVVTSIGAGDSEKQAPLFFKVLMMTVMSGIFKDKNNQESIFLRGPGSDLEVRLRICDFFSQFVVILYCILLSSRLNTGI